MLRHEEHRLDVDLHHATPVLFALVDDGATAADADVVVEEIEAPEAIEGGLDHGRAIPRPREVRLHGDRLAGQPRDGLHGVLGERKLPVHHDHARAGLGEQDGGGAAIADTVTRRPATRHDRDLARESPVVPCVEIHAPSSPVP